MGKKSGIGSIYLLKYDHFLYFIAVKFFNTKVQIAIDNGNAMFVNSFGNAYRKSSNLG